LFPQIGLKFLENRDNPDAFEPAPDAPAIVAPAAGAAVYSVRVNGRAYTVEVAESGQLSDIRPGVVPAAAVSGDTVNAVLAGNIFKVHVAVGDVVDVGDPLLVVEAMKMETVVVAPKAGAITQVSVAEGDVVAVGDLLVAID
jgi:oxaloacetate decarboxylase alpha subunit